MEKSDLSNWFDNSAALIGQIHLTNEKHRKVGRWTRRPYFFCYSDIVFLGLV